jgi:hypothetical protein
MQKLVRGGSSSGGGGGSTEAHDLGGPLHTGTLRTDQAPWAMTTAAFAVHRDTPNAHLRLATNSGLTTVDSLLTLGTPTTLSVATSNGVTGTGHTHAITTTPNGRVNASTILRSSSDFGLEMSYVRLAAIIGYGDLLIAGSADIILDPTGNDVRPQSNYDVNLGSINRKWLTFHAAELWVETLVAQETIATIGGRILVGPTTTLIADLTTIATTIDVKHNQMASGNRVYMESNGKIEFMAITSGATAITGGFRYSVTRNLDGTGANEWYAGDAVFNTGSAGNGFIDLYSLYGVPRAGQSSTQRAGPTIVGNVRLSSTFNDFRERWAIGSLNGLYDYGTEVYGFAAGDPTTAWVAADATNGVRLMNGGSERIRLAVNGDSYFAGIMKIGTSGEIQQGTGTLGSNYTGLRIWRDSDVGRIGGYNNNVLQWYANTDGRLYAGGGGTMIDNRGIHVSNNNTSEGYKLYASTPMTDDTHRAARLWTLSGEVNPQVYMWVGRHTGFGDASNSTGFYEMLVAAGANFVGIKLDGSAGEIAITKPTGYVAGATTQTGYVTIRVNGTNYKFLCGT